MIDDYQLISQAIAACTVVNVNNIILACAEILKEDPFDPSFRSTTIIKIKEYARKNNDVRL